MTPAEQACKIQQLASAASWLRLTLHLTGAAALCALGFRRGTDAIPIGAALLAPNLIFIGLLYRLGGEPRSYSQYVGRDAASTVRLIAAAARQRQHDPRSPRRDALWWLDGYVRNVTLSLAVAFAIDAFGAPLPLTIAGAAAMLALTGIVNTLDLRLRMLDALLMFSLAADRPADETPDPTEGR